MTTTTNFFTCPKCGVTCARTTHECKGSINNMNDQPVGLFTKEQIQYVDSVADGDLREHLLHQTRLRDINGNTAAAAVAILTSEFAKDPDFAWSWHCNIACAATDEGVDSEVANAIAARFMKSAFEAEGYEPPNIEPVLPRDCACQTWDWSKLDGSLNHHPNCDGHGNIKNGVYKESEIKGILEPDTALSLLVVDLGDACVLRVEKGQIALSAGGEKHWQNDSDGVDVIKAPFDEVKAAIDAMDKPTLPEVKAFHVKEAAGHLELMFNDWHIAKSRNPQAMAESVRKLNYILEADRAERAGHPLPVYEGGKWEELFPDAGGVCKVWRYRR